MKSTRVLKNFIFWLVVFIVAVPFFVFANNFASARENNIFTRTSAKLEDSSSIAQKAYNPSPALAGESDVTAVNAPRRHHEDLDKEKAELKAFLVRPATGEDAPFGFILIATLAFLFFFFLFRFFLAGLL